MIPRAEIHGHELHKAVRKRAGSLFAQAHDGQLHAYAITAHTIPRSAAAQIASLQDRGALKTGPHPLENLYMYHRAACI